MREFSLPSFGKFWLATMLLLASMTALSGCNTISGLGEDVESAGDAVSDTAKDAQD